MDFTFYTWQTGSTHWWAFVNPSDDTVISFNEYGDCKVNDSSWNRFKENYAYPMTNLQLAQVASADAVVIDTNKYPDAKALLIKIRHNARGKDISMDGVSLLQDLIDKFFKLERLSPSEKTKTLLTGKQFDKVWLSFSPEERGKVFKGWNGSKSGRQIAFDEAGLSPFADDWQHILDPNKLSQTPNLHKQAPTQPLIPPLDCTRLIDDGLHLIFPNLPKNVELHAMTLVENKELGSFTFSVEIQSIEPVREPEGLLQGALIATATQKDSQIDIWIKDNVDIENPWQRRDADFLCIAPWDYFVAPVVLRNSY